MLTRRWTGTLATAVLMLLAPGTARAGDDIWDSLDCSQGPVAGCELRTDRPQIGQGSGRLLATTSRAESDSPCRGGQPTDARTAARQ